MGWVTFLVQKTKYQAEPVEKGKDVLKLDTDNGPSVETNQINDLCDTCNFVQLKTTYDKNNDKICIKSFYSI